MKKVEFLVDFATKKKGDVWECASDLASQLVRVDKVAKYYEENLVTKGKKESKPKKDK